MKALLLIAVAALLAVGFIAYQSQNEAGSMDACMERTAEYFTEDNVMSRSLDKEGYCACFIDTMQDGADWSFDKHKNCMATHARAGFVDNCQSQLGTRLRDEANRSLDCSCMFDMTLELAVKLNAAGRSKLTEPEKQQFGLDSLQRCSSPL